MKTINDESIQIENNHHHHHHLAQISIFEKRHDMASELSKVRDITDAAERQQFLETARRERDAKREEERAARDQIVHKRNALRSKVEALYGSGEL